jgi:uncharacterized protein DUF4332
METAIRTLLLETAAAILLPASSPRSRLRGDPGEGEGREGGNSHWGAEVRWSLPIGGADQPVRPVRPAGQCPPAGPMPPRILRPLCEVAEGSLQRLGQLAHTELATQPLVGEAFAQAPLLDWQRRLAKQEEPERSVSIGLALHCLRRGAQDVQQQLGSGWAVDRGGTHGCDGDLGKRHVVHPICLRRTLDTSGGATYPVRGTMAMKTLEYLRGISAEDCRKLRARGIRHTNQLLHATTLDIDRRRLSSRTGISADRLLEFGRQCALLEISGMERFQPIIRRLGITSLKILKRTDPVELHSQVVDAVGLAGAPSLTMVQYWISQARTCDILEEPDAALPQWESSIGLTAPVVAPTAP